MSESRATIPICSLLGELINFSDFGSPTVCSEFHQAGGTTLPVFTNEFWTSKQRAGHSIHEISYRACFKPQLPAFFIDRLTAPGDVVYDPFMGRGTTPIEAALRERVPVGCDISPLGEILCAPRLSPPCENEIRERLAEINLERPTDAPEELLAFFHKKTLAGMMNLRRHFSKREANGELDRIDRWIRMVATNRLTGHSPGFFSGYTLPPNQAVSVERQLKINAKRQQVPPVRDIRAIILKKTRTLLRDYQPASELPASLCGRARFLTGSCDSTPEIESGSVQLVVTSPPFLDVVNYREDNWMRCWFNVVDPESVNIWQLRKESEWQARMTGVLKELKRVLKPGGYIAFEVGEVRGGKLSMENLVVPAGMDAGLHPELIMINAQDFTKTSNCWGVDNQSKGTNTNRIVVFGKK